MPVTLTLRDFVKEIFGKKDIIHVPSMTIDESWLDCAYHNVIDNPVLARIVSEPEEYRWSILGANDEDLDQFPNLFVNDYSRLERKFSREGIERFKRLTRAGKLFEGTEYHVT